MFRITYYRGGNDIRRIGEWIDLFDDDVLRVEVITVEGISMFDGFDFYFLKTGIFGGFYTDPDTSTLSGQMLRLRPGLPAEFLGESTRYIAGERPAEAIGADVKIGATIERRHWDKYSLRLRDP